jgi:hypothetical protein
MVADRYGYEGLMAIAADQKQIGYSSTEAFNALGRNPDLINVAPNTFSLLFPGDKYSPELAAKFRQTGTQGEKFSVSETMNAMDSVVYKVQRERLDRIGSAQNWTNAQKRAAKSALGQTWAFGTPDQIPFGYESTNSKVDELRKAITMVDNEAAQGAKIAIAVREAGVRAMKERGAAITLGAKANADIAAALTQQYNKIIEDYPMSKLVIDTVFLIEVGE